MQAGSLRYKQAGCLRELQARCLRYKAAIVRESCRSNPTTVHNAGRMPALQAGKMPALQSLRYKQAGSLR
jgi:hypothetical protein